MTKFFCWHSCKDIKRRKCNFCLAFCSVFIVVLSTLLINTIIGFGPIIFLKMGETNIGQYDGIFLPIVNAYDDLDSYENSNVTTQSSTEFLNFTQVSRNDSNGFNLAPRK